MFVVGTGRAGTSILHELLALDPAHRVPLTWELLHPGDAVGPGADDARRAGHAVHAFWADVQPDYATMHHNDGDEPNECIFATMLEFLSDQWGGTYQVPSLLHVHARPGPLRRLPLPPPRAADPAAQGPA